MMSTTAPLAFRCPVCGARPGLPCMGMEPKVYHATRWGVAHNGESDAERQRKFRILQEMFKP